MEIKFSKFMGLSNHIRTNTVQNIYRKHGVVGQITKHHGEKEWTASIRDAGSMDVIRYAGAWKRLKDAKEEVADIMQDYAHG